MKKVQTISIEKANQLKAKICSVFEYEIQNAVHLDKEVNLDSIAAIFNAKKQN